LQGEIVSQQPSKKGMSDMRDCLALDQIWVKRFDNWTQQRTHSGGGVLFHRVTN